MFVQRLISGIFLIIAAVLTITFGGNVLLATVGILSLIGQFELYRVLKLEKTALAMVGYLATIAYQMLLFFDKMEYFQVYSMTVLLCVMIVYVLAYPKFVFREIAMIFIGLVYVTISLSCLYQVRCMEGGIYLVWIIFLAAWGSDTCAYCVGKLIGKHKLPSPLSPKKTIEGCTGGIVGAGLLAFLYAWILKDSLSMYGYTPVHFVLMGLIGGFLSQIGDLAASAIKRNFEIKDYGKLIPGHGGVMDRFDSILFTAPLAFIFFTLLG